MLDTTSNKSYNINNLIGNISLKELISYIVLDYVAVVIIYNIMIFYNMIGHRLPIVDIDGYLYVLTGMIFAVILWRDKLHFSNIKFFSNRKKNLLLIVEKLIFMFLLFMAILVISEFGFYCYINIVEYISLDKILQPIEWFLLDMVFPSHMNWGNEYEHLTKLTFFIFNYITFYYMAVIYGSYMVVKKLFGDKQCVCNDVLTH